MSTHARRLYWRKSEAGFVDDPRLIIETFGVHDVYRLADHLERGQVEFAAMGRRIKRGLRRKLGHKSYAALLDYMHGSGEWTEGSDG